ncbi:MAG: aspartate aminotransferase family protein [Planctomycetota bacterium]
MPELKVEASKALYERAKDRIPGGGVTESKKPLSLFAQEEAPAYFRSAEGARLVDVDGNEYIDFGMALGPILLGYNVPEVNEAISKQLERGILASLCNEQVIRLAERLAELVPCAESVRLLKTGAEACAAAVRVARAATGREKVLTCGYHGWHDWCQEGRGIPSVLQTLAFPFAFNDLDSFRGLFDNHGGEIAAVVMEPVLDREPAPGFLQAVRDRCTEAGAVLVYDEIKTGFRMALGGAQERYGVVPDLAVLGKGMANGMPLAALVGKQEIMKVLEEVWVSSTYAGEVLSVAACHAVLDILQREPVIEHLWRLGTKMFDGLREIADRHPEMLEAGGIPPMNFLRFREGIMHGEAAERMFFLETLGGGILLKRIAYNFLCFAHTGAEVERALDVTGSVVDRVWARFYG